jgi:hypothetical protein
MLDLFTRTLSHALQAALPVAFWWAWVSRRGDAGGLRAIRGGLLVALPATIAAALAFHAAARPMVIEVVLAALTAILMTRGTRALSEPTWLTLSIGTSLVVVRQSMVVASTLWIVVADARSLDGALVMIGSIAVAIAVALAVAAAARRLHVAPLRAALITFAAAFLAETAFCVLHKLAESRLIPSAEAIDLATEPYGPDGIYGFYLTYALAVVPFAAAAIVAAAQRFGQRLRRALAIGAGTAFGVGGMLVVLIARGPAAVEGTAAPAAASAPVPVSAEVSTVSAVPHVLFRGSRQDANYGRMMLTPLASAGAQRAATEFGCDRVSFGVSRGICLHADRGIRTKYSAILFDESFNAIKTLPLEGEPSRTRISRDGRVGAYTVFVTGITHGYASASFSTSTVLINMATGDVIGNLEEFATYRDGKRIKAADFNFWGVTFARDSNTFYATMQSGGRTHLVRGDLGLRTLTVIYDDLECPSLSPDETLIAFKKRVGPALAPWRIYILDLATMKERPVAAESRSIDDQMEWLDNAHILYGTQRSSQTAVRDVWVAPIDGPGPAKVFLPEAESPIVVR